LRRHKEQFGGRQRNRSVDFLPLPPVPNYYQKVRVGERAEKPLGLTGQGLSESPLMLRNMPHSLART
jgi:hypothetical protein